MTDESSVGTEQCDRCGSEGETTTLYRDGRVWACLCIECHDQIAEFALTTPDEPGQTPQDKWEEHNEPFDYEPPQKSPELWSSDEYQELHDRFISRRTQWFCDKCSGRGPIGSLQKARRHVQNQHSPDLVRRYAPDEDELETATDGGASEDRATKRAEENYGLGNFAGDESE